MRTRAAGKRRTPIDPRSFESALQALLDWLHQGHPLMLYDTS